MNLNLALKLMIDLGLAVTILLAFGLHITGLVAHEFIGLAVFILLVAHNTLNWRWYKSPGRHRRPHLAATFILVAATLMTVASSLFVSKHVFDFVQIGDAFLMRRIHVLAAYWLLVLMSVHAGLHWKVLISVMGRAFGLQKPNRLRAALLRLSALGIIIFGIKVSFERAIGSRLLMRESFDYWEGGFVELFPAYLAIMGLYIGLAHYFLKLFPHAKKSLPRPLENLQAEALN